MFGLTDIPFAYRLGALALAAASLFAYGRHLGVGAERARWEFKQAKEQAGIAAELIAATQAAARSARTILDHLAVARLYVGQNQVRTQFITREITRVVDSTPSLAVPLPAVVRELRAEQAAQSAALADLARRGAEERHRAVQPAGR